MNGALAALVALDGCAAQGDAICTDAIDIMARLTQPPDALAGATTANLSGVRDFA